MSQDSERLLESDRLEEVLGEPVPQQPVVVVQYRRRRKPWIPVLVVALVAVAGSTYELHRREVERLRLRAMSAQDQLRDLKEQSLAGKILPPGTAGPIGQVTATATTPAPAAVASGGSPGSEQVKVPSPTPPSPSPSAPTVAGPERSGPATAGISETPPAPVGPVANATPSAAAGASATPPAKTETGSGPPAAAGPVAASTVPDPPRRGIVVERATSLPGPEDGAAIAAGVGNAAEDSGGNDAIAFADAGEPPVPGGASPEAPAGAMDDQPLPSREETEREIREEARRRLAESRERTTRQHEEVQDIRHEERQRFRDELRLILEIHGKDAGKRIAELSDRSGRNDDPVLHAMAIRVIGSRGTSQKAKVQRLRAIGVPEPVILDFLANELHRNLGARNGPRSREDVWVQASRLLLRYDWKPQGTPAPGNQSAAAEPDAQPVPAGPAAQPAAARATEPAPPGR